MQGQLKLCNHLTFFLTFSAAILGGVLLKRILQHFQNHCKKALPTESYFKFKYRPASVTLLNSSIRTIILIESLWTVGSASKVYLRSSQISKNKFFAKKKKVNGFWPLIFFPKSSCLDVWLGSISSSGIYSLC